MTPTVVNTIIHNHVLAITIYLPNWTVSRIGLFPEFNNDI